MAGVPAPRKGHDIERRLLRFAAQASSVIDALPDNRMGRRIASQLVRSASAPLSHYAEACASESRNDFIHKLSIALKELRESSVWIELIIEAQLEVDDGEVSSLLDECRQLGNILGKSLVTARANANKRGKRE